MIFTNSFKTDLSATEYETVYTATKSLIVFNFVVANKSESGDFISLQLQTGTGADLKTIMVLPRIPVPYASTFILDGKIVLNEGDKILARGHSNANSLDLTMSIIEV